MINGITINFLSIEKMGLLGSLDVQDITILEYIVRFLPTEQYMSKIIDGKEFKRISISKMTCDIPMLGLTTNKSINNRLDKLVSLRFLEKKTIKGESVNYYRFGDNYAVYMNGGEVHTGVVEVEKRERDRFDFQDIVDYWNVTVGDIYGKCELNRNQKGRLGRLMRRYKMDEISMKKLIYTLRFADDWLMGKVDKMNGWKPTFIWWIDDKKGWFGKLKDGFCHNSRREEFFEVMSKEEVPVYTEMYRPIEGIGFVWDDNKKCYFSLKNADGVVYDGYTDDNRPSCAVVFVQGYADAFRWNVDSKKWIDNNGVVLG